MSGRNQHHFWQVLQRGFGVERKPDYTTVFVYQRNKTPFPVGTRNFGAERDFFDFAPGSGADTFITKIEGELQGLVRHFQNGGQVTSDHTAPISVLISHLEIRTKFFRQHFSESISDVATELNRWFENPKMFVRFMRKFASENPEQLDAHLSQYIEDPKVRVAISGFLIENLEKLDGNLIESASGEATGEIKNIMEHILELVKHSHIKAILNAEPESNRKNRYLGLKYRLRSNFDEELICPDTMVAFLTDRKPTPFLDKNARIEAVWIPLTSNLMLIGEPSAHVDRTNQEVLRVLASTSHKAFIASSDTPSLRRLTSRIGKNAKVLSAADIQSIKRKTLSGLL